MPVATLTEFVAEQTVAIVIGVAAILVAPKAGPKLAEFGAELAGKARSSLDPNAAGDQPTAGVPPSVRPVGMTAAVAAAGRGLAGAVAGGAQQLADQWSNLIDEVRTSTVIPAQDPPAAVSVLSSVAGAQVVSRAPGRIRLRLALPPNQPQMAEQVAGALAALDGVVQAQANTRTGSVLLLYDTGRYATPEALLAGAAQMFVQRRDEERR